MEVTSSHMVKVTDVTSYTMSNWHMERRSILNHVYL